MFWYVLYQFPPVVVSWQTAPSLFWKHPFGLLTVVFLFSVVCRSEEVNSPSTTSTPPVTVGLSLFWFDKNSFLSLPEFAVVASICTEFPLGSTAWAVNKCSPRSLVNSINVAFGDAISCMYLFWISKTFSWVKANIMFTEFITNPKNSISFPGVSCDYFKFITKPDFCNRKINVSFACEISFNVWTITSMSFKNIIILTLILLNKAIGIIGSFVKIRRAGPRPKHEQRDSYTFPSHWRRIYFFELLFRGMPKSIFIKKLCSWRISFMKCIPLHFEMSVEHEAVQKFEIYFRSMTSILLVY